MNIRMKEITAFHSIAYFEGVHLTLLPHIISVQGKSRSMLHHGSVGASLKQNKRNIRKPNPNPNLILNVLLPSIVFHNKI